MAYSTDGASYAAAVPTATNAGEYTVWYKVRGDESYNDTKAQSVAVTVSKADPPGDAPGPLNATVGDPLESVKLPTDSLGTWTWEADPGATVDHAGECYFDALFTPSDTTNYNEIPGVIVTVNAAKGPSSVTAAPAGRTLAYNGALQELVAAGEAEGGTMMYSLDGENFFEKIPAAVEVGTYKVWYMVAGDEDHNDSEARQVTSEIGRGDVSQATVELERTSYVYDGNAKTPTARAVLGGRELVAGTDYDVAYANNVNAGTATVTLTGKGNYMGTAKATFLIVEKVAMHRLYNPNSGEHFYTAVDAERDNLVALGWNSEGEGWTAPATSETPVYRLYNAVGGEHHYTTDASERDMLVSAGWNDEGIGWYSDDAQGVPLHREYNPNQFACNHNYTASLDEHEYLVSIGWRDEGIAWYGVAE